MSNAGNTWKHVTYCDIMQQTVQFYREHWRDGESGCLLKLWPVARYNLPGAIMHRHAVRQHDNEANPLANPTFSQD